MLLHLNIFACSIIVAWSLWATLSRRVEVGALGKTLLCYACLSAFAVALGPEYGYRSPHPSEVNLNVALALLGLRQVFVKYWWNRIRDRFFCSDCPRRRSSDTQDFL